MPAAYQQFSAVPAVSAPVADFAAADAADVIAPAVVAATDFIVVTVPDKIDADGLL